MSEVVVVPYVETVLREQDAYRAAPPSLLPRAVRSLAGPFDKLAHKLIPPEAIEAAIRGADWAASTSIRKSSVNHDFSDLEACDDAVRDVRNWALGYAVTGGGAAGAFGAFGLVVDVPAKAVGSVMEVVGNRKAECLKMESNGVSLDVESLQNQSKQLEKEIPYYNLRHLVKPGIS